MNNYTRALLIVTMLAPQITYTMKKQAPETPLALALHKAQGKPSKVMRETQSIKKFGRGGSSQLLIALPSVERVKSMLNDDAFEERTNISKLLGGKTLSADEIYSAITSAQFTFIQSVSLGHMHPREVYNANFCYTMEREDKIRALLQEHPGALQVLEQEKKISRRILGKDPEYFSVVR